MTPVNQPLTSSSQNAGEALEATTPTSPTSPTPAPTPAPAPAPPKLATETPPPTTSTAPPQKAKKIRVAEAVESGVEGLLRFLQRLALTALRVLFRPREGLRAFLADRRSEPPSYVLPLTFLAIGVFLLSLLGQTAGVFVLDWIWFTDDIAQKITEALRKEVSLASVVVQAIPGMAGVLVLASVCQLLGQPWPLTHRLVQITYAYAMGAQALMLFIVAFGLISVGTLTSSRFTTTADSTFVAYLTVSAAIVGMLTAFIGPAIFMFRSLRLRSIAHPRRRMSMLLFRAWILASILGGHVLILYGARAPNELISAAKGSTTPAIDVGSVTFTMTKVSLLIDAVVTLKNRKDTELTWLTKDVDLRLQVPKAANGARECSSDWLHVPVLRVTDARGDALPFVQLDAAKSTWLTLHAEIPLTAQISEKLRQTKDWATFLNVRTSVGEGSQICAYRTLAEIPAATSHTGQGVARRRN